MKLRRTEGRTFAGLPCGRDHQGRRYGVGMVANSDLKVVGGCLVSSAVEIGSLSGASHRPAGELIASSTAVACPARGEGAATSDLFDRNGGQHDDEHPEYRHEREGQEPAWRVRPDEKSDRDVHQAREHQSHPPGLDSERGLYEGNAESIASTIAPACSIADMAGAFWLVSCPRLQGSFPKVEARL